MDVSIITSNEAGRHSIALASVSSYAGAVDSAASLEHSQLTSQLAAEQDRALATQAQLASSLHTVVDKVGCHIDGEPQELCADGDDGSVNNDDT